VNGIPGTHPKRSRRVRLTAVVSAAALATALTGFLASQAQAATPVVAAHTTQAATTATVTLHGKTYHVSLAKPTGIMPMNSSKSHETQAGRHATSLSQNSTAATVYPPTISTTGLNYGGGPLQLTPQIYLDFWGSQWDSDSNGVENYMQNLFNGLGASGDTWSTVMSQYTDSNGSSPSFNGAVLGGSWVDNSSAAPSAASQAQLAAEADNAASHFGVSGPNIDVFVLSPSGTQPNGFPNAGFCAWHDWSGTVAYTNMPYVLDAGSSCGASSVQNQLDGFSIVGGHEYAEAVTDPQPSSGYVDSNGEENGDLCAWDNDQTVNFGTGTFAMQPLYSNSAGGCVFSSQ
jgi:serine protease